MRHTGLEQAVNPEEMSEAEQREHFFNEVQLLIFDSLNLDFSSDTLIQMGHQEMMHHITLFGKLSAAMGPIFDRYGRMAPDSLTDEERNNPNFKDRFDASRLDNIEYRKQIASEVIEALRVQNAEVIKEIENLPKEENRDATGEGGELLKEVA